PLPTVPQAPTVQAASAPSTAARVQPASTDVQVVTARPVAANTPLRKGFVPSPTAEALGLVAQPTPAPAPTPAPQPAVTVPVQPAATATVDPGLGLGAAGSALAAGDQTESQ